MTQEKLIFVYNADSGKLNAMLDIAHKMVSPSTYACDLCSITHGVLSEKEAWSAFRAESERELVFYHRDEFEEQYDQRFTYPVVLQEEEGSLREVLTAAQIASVNDPEQLIGLIRAL